MKLETENYSLRPLLVEDASECYLSWLKDKEISRTLDADGDALTLESLAQYIESHDNKTSFLLGIFTKDGKHIGTHSFRHYPRHKLATVGVMIGDRDFWGKAVPLETRSRVLDWAFDVLDCNKVEAGCYSINLPSIYNFKRQHWRMEGVRKSHRVVDGKPVDMILFGMLREEWNVQR
jgi:[ribosomal protein S5]-alanine N-acetyltransferase